ncbi:hypothetical protein SCLCIDRAFT_30612 [Scleroderma citrinum Foug A]|uniref:Uncharacterized protein n=1 Tax=Scleroderma citrinum Foug A TaxID=1036808 RepID=A0A0C3D2T5_9AGAM|nr:hypothetical protein SCLCIDRAFT_30612 [Scleroderma citrinum Foug A]
MVLNIVPRLPWLPALKGLQIDWIALLRSRSRFDTATSTDESNDSVSTFWMVTGWLHESGALQFYRSDFDSAAVTPGSVDLPVTFQVVSGWLRYAGAYPVQV